MAKTYNYYLLLGKDKSTAFLMTDTYDKGETFYEANYYITFEISYIIYGFDFLLIYKEIFETGEPNLCGMLTSTLLFSLAFLNLNLRRNFR